MHHVLAFTATMTAGSTNEQVAALSDGIVTISSNQFIFDRDMKLWAAYVQGATITEARVNTPAFRVIALPRIEPVNVAALPGDLFPLCDWRMNPTTIKKTDGVALETSNGAGAGERHWGILFVGEGVVTEPRGEVYTIRAAGTTTVTANAWSQCNLTFEQTLPGGEYEILGMRFISTTAVAGRIILAGGGFRPGCIGVASQAQDDRNLFRAGKFGSYGTFKSYAPPVLEALCTGADTAQTVYFDVVRRSAA